MIMTDVLQENGTSSKSEALSLVKVQNFKINCLFFVHKIELKNVVHTIDQKQKWHSVKQCHCSCILMLISFISPGH